MLLRVGPKVNVCYKPMACSSRSPEVCDSLIRVVAYRSTAETRQSQMPKDQMSFHFCPTDITCTRGKSLNPRDSHTVLEIECMVSVRVKHVVLSHIHSGWIWLRFNSIWSSIFQLVQGRKLVFLSKNKYSYCMLNCTITHYYTVCNN